MPASRWLAALLASGAAIGLALPAEAGVHRLGCAHVLGTSFDLTAVGGDRATAEAAFAAALTETHRLDLILSGWRQDSELVRFNAGEGGAVSPELFEVISAAETWRARSGGAFDGRLGLAEAAWRAGQAEAGERRAAEARAARLVVDADKRAVHREAGAVLALDGLAKGYVVDAALAAARRAAPGLEGLMIDIGGDVAVWGRGPGGAWRVGLVDPARPEDNAAPVALIALHAGAVATSGRGPRGALHFGRDGRPAGTVMSATVHAACAMDADALSTALMALPPREGVALVERVPGAEARLVDAGGRAHVSSGWLRLASDAPPARLIRAAATAPAAAWPEGFVVQVDYELPKPDRPPAYSPYVSIWVTDAAGRLVRQVLLQGNDLNYIDQNYVWWRRYGRSLPRLDAISRPTRPAGRYSAVWDGKDQAGRAVGQGRYTIHIEAIREHGSHSYQAVTLDLGAQATEGKGAAGDELGPSRVRYGRR